MARFFSMIGLGSAGIAAAIVAAGPAIAQDGASPAALESLQECRAIADSTARLACYDRETDALTAAVDAGEVRVVSRDETREARRSLFGFKLPSLGLFGGSNDDEDEADKVDSITSTITRVSAAGRGTYFITIEQDGAIWETTESSPFFRRPDVGESVEVKRAALGSFFLSVEGRKRVRARRVE